MAFVPRTRDAIKSSLLADLQARHAALGEQLLTIDGSDDEMRAAALAMELEALEAQAAAVALNILPDTADTESLDRHGVVEGLPREPPVAAVITVTITDGPLSTVTGLSGQLLLTPTGVAYLLVDANGAALASLTTNGAGLVTTAVYGRCTETGTVGNVAVGATLTWSSAPTGFGSSTIEVATLATTGAAAETNDAYARRIVARRQSRPASGNAEDWRDVLRRFVGVEDAYVYPLLDPDGVVDTLGCVTALPMGPAQGDSTTNSRILSGDAITQLIGYVEGTHDAAGNAVTNGAQWRPVTMASGDYTIEAATEASPQNVEILLVNNTANAFPWSGRHAKVAAAIGPPETVTVAGNLATLASKACLIFVGTATARGGFVSAVASSAVFGGVNTVVTFPTGTFLGAVPANDYAGYVLYPAPPNWGAIRSEVFDHFDALGPGEGSSGSLRYPSEDVQARATFYRAGLLRDVMGVSGTLNATIPTTPAADITPAIKTIVTLGQLVIRSA